VTTAIALPMHPKAAKNQTTQTMKLPI